MKVLHVIPWISRRQGGPSRSSQGLVAAQCAAGVDAWLQPLEPSEEPWIPGVRYYKGCDCSEGLSIDDLKNFDLVHLHEIWNPKLHQVALLCRKAGIPYIVAPRGMLEPWSLKQKWLKKRIARFLYQDKDLKQAAALHATAESEAEQFRKLGFKNYCIVSPNGVNLPSENVGSREEGVVGSRWSVVGGRGEKGVGGRRRALFVSRMHGKKGVLELVEAWGRVKPAGWCCELVYTMNSDEERAYEQKVKNRILALGMSYQDKDGTIHSSTSTQDFDFLFTGPLDDEAKWQAYARADLFVLPTYSENFGIVVAEALWAGVPVITTKGTPWRELEGEEEGVVGSRWSVVGSMGEKGVVGSGEREKCGWWIDLPTGDGLAKWDALDEALKEAVNLDSTTTTSNYDSLKRMGRRGHDLVARKYTWPAVAKTMIEGYERVVVGSR